MTSSGPPTFTRVMTDHDDLTGRLGALGSVPVPDDVRADHLHAMRAADFPVAAPDERRRFGRVAVAAAAIVGFVVGSTGFAMAGALPAPAQGVAHDVLSVVQVDVPDHPDNRGGCVSAAARTKDRAAKAACPKGEAAGAGRSADAPGHGGEARGRPAEAGPHPNADTSDCTGKPPWAGPKDRAAREQAGAERDAHIAACPDRDRDEEVEPAEPAEPPADAG